MSPCEPGDIVRAPLVKAPSLPSSCEYLIIAEGREQNRQAQICY
jgi:hypothetical protein